MIRRTPRLVAMLCLVAFATASAQGGHTDFSGIWVLDAGKTVIDGQASAPTAATATIVQHGDTITMDRESTTAEAGTVKNRSVWGLDGKPWKNVVVVGGDSTPVTSVLAWDGPVLVFKSSMTVQGDVEVQLTDRWTKASDGHGITMVRTIEAMGQQMGTLTMVFVKK
jgi:hypothetical protein